ncbi:acyltransferase [Paenibacillus sp. strain BS8-2]
MDVNPSEATRVRMTELDLVRAFAIIGVITVHASSFATMEMSGQSFVHYFPYITLNIASKFGTPVFLFLSSLVLFMRYTTQSLTKETLGTFYKKRVNHIIIPYIVFSTIYYIAVSVTRPEAELPSNYAADFIVKLSTGTAYAHLYFIFINIQFYLLFPLLIWIFRTFPRLMNWAVPIGIFIQGSFYIIGTFTPIPHAASFSLSYFAYYLLGAYVGSNYSVWRERLLSTRLTSSQRYGLILIFASWISIGATHIFIWYKLRALGISYPEWTYYLLWSVYAFLSCIVFTYTAAILEQKQRFTHIILGLKSLAASSFGIYLLHPLLLAFYREFKPSLTSLSES